MIRKILHIVVWIMILSWFIVIMGFITDHNEEVLCKRLSIEIADSSKVKFITPETVRSLVKSSGFDIQGYPVSGINTRELERIIEENPYVKNSEIYATVDGDLFVEVEQRRPVIRVMPGGRKGFYIDTEGQILPLSSAYTPMVLLVTGHIDLPDDALKEGLALKDPTDEAYGYMINLLEFARYIDNHPFWNEQIVQLYRNSHGEYEIIPRVGAHQIMLGSMNNYEEKLRNLKLLYDQGFQKYGWNNYRKINLKYSNQVICTKR